MIYLITKTLLSAILIVAIGEIAKRSPTLAALVASLPLVSLLAMVWMWRDTGDAARIANHAEATFWYVLPSLPIFLLMPALIRSGFSFWIALMAGITLTAVLYVLTAAILARFGITL